MTIKRSPISWTDYSGGALNFVMRGTDSGDCEVSPGCAHCYAGAILRRNSRMPNVTTYSPAKLHELERWQPVEGDTPYRRGAGSRPMAFVCDMGDLFHDSVPTSFIIDALNVMARRSDVDWQILTKRTRRMYFTLRGFFAEAPPPNIWLMTSVENQTTANERVKWLLSTPAAVHGLSMEPLLGPVDLWQAAQASVTSTPFDISWVIVGGESGPNRRPFNPEWASEIRLDILPYYSAFFYKQGSALRPGQDDLLNGVTYKDFPQ